METKPKKFNDDLAELRKFLADRKLLGELALRADAKSRTVQYTFNTQSEEELKGKKLKVYQEALIMKREIEELFSEYNHARLDSKSED